MDSTFSKGVIHVSWPRGTEYTDNAFSKGAISVHCHVDIPDAENTFSASVLREEEGYRVGFRVAHGCVVRGVGYLRRGGQRPVKVQLVLAREISRRRGRTKIRGCRPAVEKEERELTERRS
ncbi:hypothetical protein Syun_029516 [Stephania yunnanensis]|uniref:Uncharacterized protein n=1 Tax=Stephania yunnanensis TaxID=152371 RepID=A0AAP0EA51_9MAGN